MKPRTTRCDLAVIGGGPAGSTLAGFFKKYNPKRRVLLLERELFPRHHVGESLLPGVIPILEELGAFSKIENGGFVRKVGAVYIWGKPRKPMLASLVYEGNERSRAGYAWQVHRARYDQILLDHARELGVEVLQPCAVTKVLREGSRVVGLEASGPGGPLRIEAGHVADCTGQQAVLDRGRGHRKLHKGLRNIALYGYFRGDPFKNRHSGTFEKSRIFISQAGGGWFWYIPISKDVVSVGLVIKSDEVARRGKADLEKFFSDRLRRSPEISPILKKLERVEDVDGSGKSLFVIQDYSFESVRACGDGWIAAGDAAAFVDPILSTGVLLAHLTAMRAAYGLTTLLKLGEKDAFARRAWSDYDGFVRNLSSSFFEMALFWYQSDGKLAGWRKLARRLAGSGRRFSTDDLASFNHLTSGVHAFESAAVESDILADKADFTLDVLRRGGDETRRPALKDSWAPRLVRRCEVYESAVMQRGTGLLAPALRARFYMKDPPFPKEANPTVLLDPVTAAVLGRIDGRTKLSELRSLPLGPGDVPRMVNNFLEGLLQARVIR